MLAHVDPKDQDELLLLFRPMTAAPGTRVFRRGDRPDGMYFIAAGRVAIQIQGRSVFLQAGSFFGELALLEGGRRTATVTAVNYCRFLILERRDFDVFMTRHPQVQAAVRDMADQRLAMNERNAPASAA